MATQEQLDYADGPADQPEWGRSWLALVGRCLVYVVAWGYLLAMVFLFPLLGDGPYFHDLYQKFHEKGTLTRWQEIFYLASRWNAALGGIPVTIPAIGLGIIAECLWRGGGWRRFCWVVFVLACTVGIWLLGDAAMVRFVYPSKP